MGEHRKGTRADRQAALDDDPDMAAEVADTRKRMGSNMDWSQQ